MNATLKRNELLQKLNHQKGQDVALRREQEINNKVASAITFVRTQYQFDGSAPEEAWNPFPEMDPNIQREVNKKLGFLDKNLGFIEKIITEKQNPGFLKFLCEED